MEWLPTLSYLRDPVSSLTHVATAVFAVYVTLLFARLTRAEPRKQCAFLVFGWSMVVLYSASGIYHAIPGGHDDATVTYFRRLDVSAIFLLIAGSFTPVIAVFVPGRRRTAMVTVVWTLAAVGVASQWILPAAPHSATVASFVAAGLPGFLPMRDYFRAVGWRGLGWGGVGCLCYLLGGACDVADWPTPIPGLVNAHEITHVLDMAGTAVHVVFMVRFVMPYQPRSHRRRERVRLSLVPAFAVDG